MYQYMIGLAAGYLLWRVVTLVTMAADGSWSVEEWVSRRVPAPWGGLVILAVPAVWIIVALIMVIR